MKTKKYTFILLLVCHSLFAQYDTGGYDSRSMRQTESGMGQESEKSKELPVEETVDKIMERLTPELKLDALQEIAVANVLIENIKSQNAIQKRETTQENKAKEIEISSELANIKLLQLLNQEQKQRYKKIKEDDKNSNRLTRRIK